MAGMCAAHSTTHTSHKQRPEVYSLERGGLQHDVIKGSGSYYLGALVTFTSEPNVAA